MHSPFFHWQTRYLVPDSKHTDFVLAAQALCCISLLFKNATCKSAGSTGIDHQGTDCLALIRNVTVSVPSVQSVSKQYGPLRTHTLPSGVSETLKVTPTRKVLQHVTSGRGGVGKVQNVISLHFEGNWMPITVSLLPASPTTVGCLHSCFNSICIELSPPLPQSWKTC